MNKICYEAIDLSHNWYYKHELTSKADELGYDTIAEMIRKLYNEKNSSFQVVGKIVGRTAECIGSFMRKYFKDDIRKKGGMNRIPSVYKRLLEMNYENPKEKLLEMYNSGMSLREIKKFLNADIHIETIRYRIKKELENKYE